jgi:hypothetical protein
MLVFTGLMVHAEPGTSQSVGPHQQATRDYDRVEILREELRKSEAQLVSLARRKAERLAASDLEAAIEAEEQHVRTLGDIAAIQREIASASHAATQTTAAKPVTVRAPRGPSAGKRAAPAPWWDVYGSSRRIEPPASFSFAPPPGRMPAESSPRPTGATP